MKSWVLGYSQPSVKSLNFDQSNLSEPELMRKILVYGRQAFASKAFSEMLSKEFPDKTIINANSSEALEQVEPNLIDLVVVTTSAASNDVAMQALGSLLLSAEVRPMLVIIGDVGFAAKPAQASILNLRGVFPDDTDPSVVLAGLRFVLSGGQYFPRNINILESSSQLPATSASNASASKIKTDRSGIMLTAKELAVLKCVVRGMPNKAISRELKIAENTTKIHVRGILRKLDCANRTEAALLAQRLNLVEAS
jgi:DNA-binding NarL/FixJ family response regulator